MGTNSSCLALFDSCFLVSCERRPHDFHKQHDHQIHQHHVNPQAPSEQVYSFIMKPHIEQMFAQVDNSNNPRPIILPMTKATYSNLDGTVVMTHGLGKIFTLGTVECF